jgi:hypothetical protein
LGFLLFFMGFQIELIFPFEFRDIFYKGFILRFLDLGLKLLLVRLYILLPSGV